MLCIHCQIQPDGGSVLQASIKDTLQSHKELRKTIGDDLVCLSCPFSASLFKSKPGADSLAHHIARTGHLLYVRVKPPQELYCGACRDFKYSPLFDSVCESKKDRDLSGVFNSYAG